MPELSVVMPVYRSAGRMRPCVDSVLAQTFTDFELVLIDDCSPDHESRELCDEYAAKDSRVKVFHLPVNGGISAARNFGMRQVSGNYIHFSDADDWLAPTMYADMIAEIKAANADVVCTSKTMVNVQAGLKTSTPLVPGRFEGKAAIRDAVFSICSRGEFSPVWSKIYKRQILEDHHQNFDSNVIGSEDIAFNFSFFQHIEKMAVLNGGYYHWHTFWSATQGSGLERDKATVDGLLSPIAAMLEHFEFSHAHAQRIFSFFLYDILALFLATSRQGVYEIASQVYASMAPYQKYVILPVYAGNKKLYVMSLLVWLRSKMILGIALGLNRNVKALRTSLRKSR